MWVGQTYYFTWLDRQFVQLEKAGGSGNPVLWMVHSGGFYTVEKQKSLGIAPELVHWFRWEALLTWLSGFLLLGMIYYSSSGLIDSDVANIPQWAGVLIGLGFIAAGWHIYDLALRSPLGQSENGFAIFSLVVTALMAWGLLHLLSGRAAYIHVGAVYATVMTANVWFRILPAQKKLIAAAAAGKPFDSKLSAQAKLRSKHNTFMAVPVVFLMISNHFPVGTYGNRYGWEIMVILIVLGWGAAKLVREA
jgi:uncharacterized membrane protein